MTKVKGKRVLKNGAIAGYVLQKSGKYVWRIIKGPKKSRGKQRGGKPAELNQINNPQLTALLTSLLHSLERKHKMGIRNRTYSDYVNDLKEIIKEIIPQGTRERAFRNLQILLNDVTASIERSKRKPHFQFWHKKERNSLNTKIERLIVHIRNIIEHGHTNNNNEHLFVKSSQPQARRQEDNRHIAVNLEHGYMQLLNNSQQDNVVGNPVDNDQQYQPPSLSDVGVQLQGGSQFINIPKIGKRKIRYQKNGKPYVIIKGKKFKL